MDGHVIQQEAMPEDRPPLPPGLERRFRLERAQWFGIPLILLIPILALFGVFGNRTDHVSASGDVLAVAVEFPSRVRYGHNDALRIALRNISGQTVPAVSVGLERRYLDGFSQLAIIPEAGSVNEREYRVSMLPLAPGEERIIIVDLTADERWTIEGSIRVESPGGAPVEVTLRTFVIP